MAEVRIKRAYTMPASDVRGIVEGLARELEEEHGITPRWRGDRVSIKRAGVSGELSFADGLIDISVKLGPLGSLYANRIRRAVEGYLDEHVV